MNSSSTPIRRDWLSKSLAGSLLGLTLALGCSGLLNLLLHSLPAAVRAQFVMWSVAPVWLGVLSGSFLFASGARAWRGLALANLLVFGVLAAARHL